MDRFLYDFVSIVREVVIEKGYLATKEQLLNGVAYGIYWSKTRNIFDTQRYSIVFDGTCIIDTKEHAEEIAKMFNEDKGVQAKLKELGLK